MNTMTYKGYTARMDFDPEERIIVGRVLDIDDIITFHGTSVAEFETALHRAVDSYIAACAQLGQAAEKPASGRLMSTAPGAITEAGPCASYTGDFAEGAAAQATRPRSATIVAP